MSDKNNIHQFLDDIEALERALEKERARNAKLRGALEFYADGEGDVLDWDRVNNPACIQDRGQRARQALEESEKE